MISRIRSLVIRNHISGITGFLILTLLLGSCGTKKKDLLQYHSDRGKRLVAQQAMVSSAHPLASEAGLKMLEQGGNAVDAAVATAFALNVVEPNMSGIGGGGSMLMWNQQDQSAAYLDFYSAKRADTYRELDYSRIDDEEFNLLPTAIPGTVAGLLQALERNGTMTRKEVMAPAIRYAAEGFPVYVTLARFIRKNKDKLTRYEGARKTFWPGGDPLEVGEILRQPELATTLKKIADEGADAFYKGELAENMVKVLNEGRNPVTLEDFARYEPQWRKAPLCGTYKDFRVLSAPLPQTGQYIIQALNILEAYDLKQMGPPTVSAEAFDILSSTLRLSIADRAEYITDPNWKDVPVEGLISKEYASKRRTMVGTGTVPEKVEPGRPSELATTESVSGCSEVPAGVYAGAEGADGKDRRPAAMHQSGAGGQAAAYADEAEGTGETTHISVVDPEGNAVSLSTTLSPVFGSGAWVNGFILNRSGFDFSDMEAGDWNGSHPYRIRASTISPTIILDNDEVRLVIGAPGGGRIPTAVVQNILYILEYDMDPLDAVRMPRIFPSSRNAGVQLEKGFDSRVLREVREMGYDLQSLSQGYARLYLVYRKEGRLIGVADPRHDGEVRGF